MPRIVFALAAAAHLYMLFRVLRLRLGAPEVIVAFLFTALAFDNLVLLFGDLVLGTGSFEIASWARYGAHVAVLPFLVQAARMVAVRANVVSAGNALVNVAAWVAVAAGIAWGIATELVGLVLVEAELLGHVRLVSADAHPPLATILTNIIVLGFAIAIWRRSGWPWLFAAALFIFLVNGASATSEYGLLAGNLAEVVFAFGWLATLRRFPATAD